MRLSVIVATLASSVAGTFGLIYATCDTPPDAAAAPSINTAHKPGPGWMHRAASVEPTRAPPTGG